MISDELRRQADNFIELDGLRDVVGRPTRDDGEMEEEYIVSWIKYNQIPFDFHNENTLGDKIIYRKQ